MVPRHSERGAHSFHSKDNNYSTERLIDIFTIQNILFIPLREITVFFTGITVFGSTQSAEGRTRKLQISFVVKAPTGFVNPNQTCQHPTIVLLCT